MRSTTKVIQLSDDICVEVEKSTEEIEEISGDSVKEVENAFKSSKPTNKKGP